MKKIYYLIILVMLTSCKKGFLELEPQSQANANGFYKTAQDFGTAVAGAYAQLQNYPNMYFELVSFRADELTLGAPTAGTQDRYNIDKFTDDPSNQILLEVWKNLYNGVARCNDIITRLPTASIPEDLKKQYDAEARFIRAYHYFNLSNFWGGVPLVTRPLTASEALLVGGSSIAEINATLEADLLIAIEKLPASFSGTNTGRATSVAARTLLAKIHLRQKKYTAVKATLQPLIAIGGTYDLLPVITQVFSNTNKNNKEIIFGIRFNKEVTGEGHPLWLTTNSATATQVPSHLLNAYQSTDSRKNLLLYARSGTSTTYVMNKFADVLSVTNRTAENDFILLRYADVLLMYAEAVNELAYASSGEAFEALNRVHTRAGLPAYPNSQLTDQQSFRDAILLERKLEFPYEGHRYFDLVRTGNLKSEIKKYELIDIKDFRQLYPIPQTEIEKINNQSIFSQNQGY